MKIVKPGTTPEVTKSAKESNCLPNSLFTSSIRAAKPSKKSNIIPATTNTAAKSKLFSKTAITANNPAIKLNAVMAFGMVSLSLFTFQKYNNNTTSH